MRVAAADSADTAVGSDRGRVQLRVELEQITLACRFMNSLFVGAALVVGIIAGLLATHSIGAASYWFSACMAILLCRMWLNLRFLSKPRRLSEVGFWRGLIISLAALNGLLWGIPLIWTKPASALEQIVLVGGVLGVAASAVWTLSPLRHAYPAFALPLFIPVGIARFFQGSIGATSAVGLWLFMLAMLFIAERYQKSHTKLLRLGFDNDALAQRLKRENERVDLVNRSLQQQIAARERIEVQLRAATATAESANRAKSQFLANMSHEVRTPLNAVLGMNELLQRTGLSAKQARYARTIKNAGERLLGVLNDILDLTRVEAGRLQLNIVSFAPRLLVGEVVELMRLQAQQKGLELSHHIEPGVPSQLCGDPDRLRQVLVNLVFNAIKFTQRGSVRIDMQAMAAAPAKDGANTIRLRCSVTDTGIGIAEAERERLFKPFSLIDESTTRRHEGTGLGLAICRQLIEAMGGRIGVDSACAGGACFWFEVTLAKALHAHSTAAAPEDSWKRFEARVLVAEDNEVNRTLLIEMLQMLGCTTVSADHGREAIRQLTLDAFDVVFVDWHMPELDGLEVVRTVRERGLRARNGERLPVIVLTASAMAGDRETCLQAGADDYLTKPFTHHGLMEKLAAWTLPAAALSGE